MDDFGVSSEFSRESTRRARKPYRCGECNDPIAVGESHSYACGKCEGQFFDARTCLACAEIRDVFSCDGWVLSTLWEEISLQLFPEWDEMQQIDCLARLKTDAAIAKMRAKYADYARDR